MAEAHPLDIRYEDHAGVRELVDAVRYCLEDISLAFDRWEDPHAHGPGLYVAVVAGRSVRPYADPMGDDRWPVADSRRVLADLTAFHGAAAEVARTRDGAVVVSVDGVVQPRMVRFRDLKRDPDRDPRADAPERERAAADRFGTEAEAEAETEDGDGDGRGYADWMGSRHMSGLDTSRRDAVVTTLTLSAETGRVTVFRDGTYRSLPRTQLAARWRGEGEP
jgi:hypothetical protein